MKQNRAALSRLQSGRMSLLGSALLWSSPAAPPTLDDAWSLAEDKLILKVAMSRGASPPFGSSGNQRSLARAIANQYTRARAQRPELFVKSEAFLQKATGFLERLAILQDSSTTNSEIVVRRRLLAGVFNIDENLGGLGVDDTKEEYKTDFVDPTRQAIFTVLNGYDDVDGVLPSVNIVTDGIKAAEYSSLVRGVVSDRSPPWSIDLTTSASRGIQQCRGHYWDHIDAEILGRFLVYCRHAKDIDTVLSKPTEQQGEKEAQVSASLPTLLLASQNELKEHITSLDEWANKIKSTVCKTVERQKAEALARVEEKYRQLLEESLNRVKSVERAAREKLEAFYKGNDEDISQHFAKLEEFQKLEAKKIDAGRMKWVDACFGHYGESPILRLISGGTALGAETFVNACSRRLAEDIKNRDIVDDILQNPEVGYCNMLHRAIPKIVSLCSLESLLSLSEKMYSLSIKNKVLAPGINIFKAEVEKELKIRKEAEQQKLMTWPAPKLERALLSARSISNTLMGKFRLEILRKVLDIREKESEKKPLNEDDIKEIEEKGVLENPRKFRLILPSSSSTLGSITDDELTVEIKVYDRFLIVGSSAILRSTAWKRFYFESTVLKSSSAIDTGPCVTIGMFLSKDGESISHLEAISRDMNVGSSNGNMIKKSPAHEGIFIQDSGHIICENKTSFADYSFEAGDTISVLVDPQMRILTFYKNGLPLKIGKGAEIVSDNLNSKLSLPGPGDSVCVVVGVGLVKEDEWRRMVEQNVELLESYPPFQLMPGCILFTPGGTPKCKVKFRFQPRFMYQIGQSIEGDDI